MTSHRTSAVTFDREFGYQAIRELLACDRKFTAIFAVIDVVASGVLVALREVGFWVLEDVSLVGYDDIPLARDFIFELTTVHVDYEELGWIVVWYVFNRECYALSQYIMIGMHVIICDFVGLFFSL